MDRQNFIHDFQQKLMELFRASPAADLERNLKALMGQTFARLDLVTREEFDVQVELLRALRQRVQALEDRLGPSGTSPRSWSETGPDVVPGASAGPVGGGAAGLGAVGGSSGSTGSSRPLGSVGVGDSTGTGASAGTPGGSSSARSTGMGGTGQET